MLKFLAFLPVPDGVTLGPPVEISERMTLQHYCPNARRQAERILVVGVVTSSLKQSDGTTVLVLESPATNASLLAGLFQGEMQTLRDLLIVDSLDMDTMIGSKELWSQRPGGTHTGYVFVRIWHETQVIEVDVSEKTAHAFKDFASEIPIATGPIVPLATGATVICCVFPCRIDQPGDSSQQEGMRARAYRLVLFL
ncbi:hypothetical protein C8F04DRAFT_1270218 [Mycena alexandri]|uniref:Uncharacterized protein n=1 Tax=Mycena alexandri TaxID=1745969 RepID=A0AAD6SFI6_9AGAR|nr:hypothetical protein C8F04DRAFT_1270218 [Mycena alexandri]